MIEDNSKNKISNGTCEGAFPTKPSLSDESYLQMLGKWSEFALKNIYFPSFDSETACFGPGDHGHWSIQTNTTAFAALAVLATEPTFDKYSFGVSQDKLIITVRKMLRFTLRSHISGNGTAYDGKQWGHSWISALAIERMMHGIEAIDVHLDDEDHMQLKNMLISESDWLLNSYEIVADIIDDSARKNRPESNIWNGSLLYRTAMMFPESSNAAAYMEKGSIFFVNGISIPEDAFSEDKYDGKLLSDLHVGANFNSNLGLNHHGYLNIGYMVICLSNIAMLHFAYKKRGIPAPKSLYHHAKDLWKIIKQCTFPDGRLWRIGGDSRVRYCYCQDYAIPMWLLIQDMFEDNSAKDFEIGWLQQVNLEQQHNGDGSFLSSRLKELEKVSPLYFFRLEGDKAVTLSMGYYWRRVFNELNKKKHSNSNVVTQSWNDKLHGAMLQRGKKRVASFVWKSCHKPTGQCLPLNDSSMAEWGWNLTGEIKGCSDYNCVGLKSHRDYSFDGGFCTCGEFEWWSTDHFAEGQENELTAREQIAFAVLPDDKTVIVMQQAKTVNRSYLKSVKGLMLNIPNDIFNQKERKYSFNGENIILKSLPNNSETIVIPGTKLSIEEQLHVNLIYGGNNIIINRPNHRQVMINNTWNKNFGKAGGNLYCDEICVPCITEREIYEAGTLLFNIGVVLTVGNDTSTCGGFQTDNGINAMKITGNDGLEYLFIANFNQFLVKLSSHVSRIIPIDIPDIKCLILKPMDCKLIKYCNHTKHYSFLN